MEWDAFDWMTGWEAVCTRAHQVPLVPLFFLLMKKKKKKKVVGKNNANVLIIVAVLCIAVFLFFFKGWSINSRTHTTPHGATCATLFRNHEKKSRKTMICLFCFIIVLKRGDGRGLDAWRFSCYFDCNWGCWESVFVALYLKELDVMSFRNILGCACITMTVMHEHGRLWQTRLHQ